MFRAPASKVLARTRSVLQGFACPLLSLSALLISRSVHPWLLRWWGSLGADVSSGWDFHGARASARGPLKPPIDSKGHAVEPVTRTTLSAPRSARAPRAAHSSSSLPPPSPAPLPPLPPFLPCPFLLPGPAWQCCTCTCMQCDWRGELGQHLLCQCNADLHGCIGCPQAAPSATEACYWPFSGSAESHAPSAACAWQQTRCSVAR